MAGWMAVSTEVVIAISAVVVSVVSLFVAVSTLSTQRKHNKLSLKPIAHFSKGDYDDLVFVSVKNNGIGPLIIDEFSVVNGGGVFNRLIDSFGYLAGETVWDGFADNINGRVLAPGDEFVLIKVSFDSAQGVLKTAIRSSLASTVLLLAYRSVYDEVQPPIMYRLEWFARH